MELLRKGPRAIYGLAYQAARAISTRTNIPISKPSIFNFDLTDRCQLNCLTCTKWKTPPEVQSHELTTNEWKDILIKMKEWLGEFTFIFSGGEPFLRKDVFELATFAKQHNIHPKIITNGYGFDRLASKIVHSGLESVCVSLNGTTPQTHDSTRGVKGAYEKTMKFINAVNNSRRTQGENRLKIQLNTMLFPSNYSEVPELVRWVQATGIDYINFQPMDPPGSFHSYPINGTSTSSLKGAGGTWYYENLGKGKNHLKLAIDQLVEMKKQNYPIINSIESLRSIQTYYHNPTSVKGRCPLGFHAFNIDPYGYVRFCFDKSSIGNIKHSSPQRLFISRKAWSTRRQIKNCRKKCHWATV